MYFTTEMRGWIHPLDARDPNGQTPSLALSYTNAAVVLQLGTTSSKLTPMVRPKENGGFQLESLC